MTVSVSVTLTISLTITAKLAYDVTFGEGLALTFVAADVDVVADSPCPEAPEAAQVNGDGEILSLWATFRGCRENPAAECVTAPRMAFCRQLGGGRDRQYQCCIGGAECRNSRVPPLLRPLNRCHEVWITDVPDTRAYAGMYAMRDYLDPRCVPQSVAKYRVITDL